MTCIRRVRSVAAAGAWLVMASLASAGLVGASIVLAVPQRAWAQVDAADAASLAASGSRLHVEPSSRATDASQPVQPVPAATGAASEPGSAIDAAMGRTARSARKPAASVLPATEPAAEPATTAAFSPPREKPPLATAAQAEQGPAAGPEDPALPEPEGEQAAGTDPPPEVLQERATGRAPPAAHPPSAEEAVEARLPEATAGKTRDGDLEAALPSESTAQGSLASLAFAPNSAELSGEAEGVLKDLAARFPVEDEAMRLQLMAYAGGEDMSASKARRLSLARALAVRSYLIANGMDGARMDVRALGDRILDPAADAPTDRVDIAMIRR